MGDYEPQEFMDLFGGMPERGEALVDPRDLADRARDEADLLRDEAQEQHTGVEYPVVHLMVEGEDAEAPMVCTVCGRETHRIEEVASCLFELNRREKAE